RRAYSPGTGMDSERMSRSFLPAEPLSPVCMDRGSESAWFLGRRLEISPLAAFEELLRRDGREEMHEPGDGPGPSRLVTGAETGPVVAVEILVEQDAIAPVGILLELPSSPIDRPSAVLVLQKGVGQPPSDLLGYLIQVHLPSRAGGTLDGEVVAV